MRLTLDEKQTKLTSMDIGTEFVRTGPTVDGDWTWVPYTSASGIELEPARLEHITSTQLHFVEVSQSTSRSVVKLDKNMWNDGRWITAQKCEKLFQKDPYLFQKAESSFDWNAAARDPGWMS